MMLWPDQVKGCTNVRKAFDSGKKRVILCSPTGSGKTVMATAVTQEEVAAGNRVTFLAPRIELITQMCKKLDEWLPLGYGLITARASAGQSSGVDLYSRVQVASVDTLVSRAVKRGNLILPPTDLLIADEIHLYMTKLRQDLFNLFGPKVRVLGLSATPAAPNGRSLGGNFEELIEVTTVAKLIREGYLKRPTYHAPEAPDMENVQVVMGEFNAKQADVKMEPLLGNILEHWMRHANGRRTVVFARKVAHSLYLRDQYLEAGVSAEHVDGETDPGERERILERFRSGETEVLCNVGIYTYGVDVPEISCIVLALATKSVVKFLQMIGRGLRRFVGLDDCVILDHGGNIHEHGYAEDDRHWSLNGYEGSVSMTKARAKKKGDSGAPRRLTCGNPECRTVFSGSLTCRVCGFFFEAMAREFHVVDGELVRFNTDDEGNIFARVKFYCELMAYARAKGKKPRWCDYTYKERFGKWPVERWASFAPLEPSRETLRYIKYRQIQWAKRQQAQRRRA